MRKKPRLKVEHSGAAEVEHQGPPAQVAMEVHYTVPLGLSFVYQGNTLCLIDKQSDMLHILKEGVAPPNTGLRAQFIWAASMPTEPAGTCRTAGQLTLKTCLEDMPDSILQLIGQEMLYRDSRADVIYKAAAGAAAASMLACTGSRAALIIAHAVWALLDPDSLKPDKHLQRLRQAQSKSIEGSLGPWNAAVHMSNNGNKQCEATVALCVLADPLQCPLSPEVQQSFMKGHRTNVANKILSHHNLSIYTLSDIGDIEAAMQEWVGTGCLNGIKQHSSMAVTEIAMRSLRLEQLHTSGSDTGRLLLRRPKTSNRCKHYIMTGIGDAAAIMKAEVKEFVNELAEEVRSKWRQQQLMWRIPS